MTTVEDLVVKFSGDITDIKAKLDTLNKGMKGTESKAVALKGTFMKVGAAIGSAFAVRKLLNDFKDVVFRMDEMADAAERLGISSESFSELAYAAKRFDVELVTLQQNLKFMQVNLAGAVTQGGAAGEAFKALGINVQELINLPANEQFYQIIAGLEGIENPALRAAIAQDIFGKSSQAVLDLVAQGAVKLRELGKEAQATGNILDKDMAAKASKLKEDLQKLESSYQGALMKLADRGGFDIAIAAIDNLGNALSLLTGLIASATDGWNEFISALEFNAGKDKAGMFAGMSKELTAAEKKISDIQSRMGNEYLGKESKARLDSELKTARAEYADIQRKIAEANFKTIPNKSSGGGSSKKAIPYSMNSAAGGGSSKDKDPLQALIDGTTTARMKELEAQIQLVNKGYETGRITFEQQQEVLSDIRQDMGNLNKNEMQDFFDGMVEGMFQGVRSWDDFKRAGLNALSAIAQKMLSSLFSNNGGGGLGSIFSGRTPDFNPSAGGSSGVGSIFNRIWDALPSFDGGGFTGQGMSGVNLDGKGGFPALLHPGETISKGSGNAGITQNIVLNSTSERDIDRRIAMMFPRLKQETLIAVNQGMKNGSALTKTIGDRL